MSSARYNPSLTAGFRWADREGDFWQFLGGFNGAGNEGGID